MRLIKCHIENFGRLCNFDYNFSEGLNIISEENGWGKSTFATFIKSMFYGLPTTTKRNLDENERKKFTPWQGGNFGGSIEFELKDKKYRIERFFGKNNGEDTFSIIDLKTGKKTEDFSANVGEEIFSLDADAFERSSFIPQKTLNSSLSESISNKLTNIIEGTTEQFNYEDAQDSLNKKRISLHNNKGTGEIQKVENDIDDLIYKMQELSSHELAISQLQKQIELQDADINLLSEEQNKIKLQIKEYGESQQKIASKEMFDKLNGQILKTQGEIEKKSKVLNNQSTSLSEIDSYILLSNNIIQEKNKIKIREENNFAQERYNYLTEYFGGEQEVPTTEQIKDISEKISKYNTLKLQTDTLEATQNGVNSNKKNKLTLIFAILSIICLVSGIITLNVNSILSIALFVLGALLLLSSGFIYLVNMINVKTSKNNDLDYQQLQTELSNLKDEITSFIARYEDINSNFSFALNEIISNCKEFEQIKQALLNFKKESEELEYKINKEEDEVEAFLSKFMIENDYNISEKLSYLKQTYLDLTNLNDRLKRELYELENFKKEKKFDDIGTQELKIEDISLLQNREKELQNRIDKFRDEKTTNIAKITKLQDELSLLDEIENEKELQESRLKDLNQELRAVKNAMKFLQEANDSLTSKFLEPTKKGLNKYLKLITNKDFDNLSLDIDFNITFEEFGKLREIDYYSKGYKNTIDLCMRFALIDALFDKERPFIVLDDPFVNLDDAKLINAKQFLKELSKTYQIIYFSCHQSRS